MGIDHVGGLDGVSYTRSIYFWMYSPMYSLESRVRKANDYQVVRSTLQNA